MVAFIVSAISMLLLLLLSVTIVCLPIAVVMYVLNLTPRTRGVARGRSSSGLEGSMVRAQWSYDNFWGGKRR